MTMYNSSFMQSLPGLFLIKNLNSVFLNMTSNLVKLVGWRTVEQSFGKTDYDVPCKVSEFAPQFINLDKRVVESGKSLLTFEVNNFPIGWKANIVERNILLDENNRVSGIFTQLIDIRDTSFFRNCMDLSGLNKKCASVKSAIYIISDNNNQTSLVLTQRQEECLFLLIRGKTTKQIANILNLSSRTVEDHIEKMKHELDCHSKSQLIEKAISAGFFYYIPKTLFGWVGFTLAESKFKR